MSTGNWVISGFLTLSQAQRGCMVWLQSTMLFHDGMPLAAVGQQQHQNCVVLPTTEAFEQKFSRAHCFSNVAWSERWCCCYLLYSLLLLLLLLLRCCVSEDYRLKWSDSLSLKVRTFHSTKRVQERRSRDDVSSGAIHIQIRPSPTGE